MEFWARVFRASTLRRRKLCWLHPHHAHLVFLEVGERSADATLDGPAQALGLLVPHSHMFFRMG
jgi:hypothetical protein